MRSSRSVRYVEIRHSQSCSQRPVRSSVARASSMRAAMEPTRSSSTAASSWSAMPANVRSGAARASNGGSPPSWRSSVASPHLTSRRFFWAGVSSCHRIPSVEQVLDREVVGAPRRAHLAPRTLHGILVGPEADEAGAVAEAALLELVEANLDHELRPQRRLLEVAGAPAVRLGEATVVLLVQQRQDERRDLVVPLRADRARADVVESAVVAVEPEQERCDLRAAARLPA